jgi:uncharacterized protein YcbK (DUF882 family)
MVSTSLRRALVGLSACFAIVAGSSGTQDAVANGDTRTLPILFTHTGESANVTFRRNGTYDDAAIKQLSWLTRDWRRDEPTRMDPRLFDLAWQVYREVGSREPIHVVSGYRSPETNGMLRRRSRAVSEHSQHMRGKAMDFYLTDVPMDKVRYAALRMQDGGVGFYPNAHNPFVHLDVGSVRAWPRLSSDQLARLFPDGKTVHVPRDGKPLPGYEEAKAQILARGGSVAGVATYAEAPEGGGGGRRSLWAMLFGGGDDEDAAYYRAQPQSRIRLASAAPASVAYSGSGNSEDGGARGFVAGAAPEPEAAQTPAASRSRRGSRTAVAAVQPPPAAEPTEEGGEALAPSAAGVPSFRRAPSRAWPPPRRSRPGGPATPDTMLVASLFASPLPPTRPSTLAAIGGSAPVIVPELNGQMRPSPAARGLAVGGDDRSQLRALFDAVATPTAPPPAPRRSHAEPRPARTSPGHGRPRHPAQQRPHGVFGRYAGGAAG